MEHQPVAHIDLVMRHLTIVPMLVVHLDYLPN
jgi:hypothetical protein